MFSFFPLRQSFFIRHVTWFISSSLSLRFNVIAKRTSFEIKKEMGKENFFLFFNEKKTVQCRIVKNEVKSHKSHPDHPGTEEFINSARNFSPLKFILPVFCAPLKLYPRHEREKSKKLFHSIRVDNLSYHELRER